MSASKLVVAVAFLAVTIAASACGDSKAVSPTQPSQTASSTSPSAATGASIAGTVVGANGIPSGAFSTRSTGLTVTVTGSNLSSAVDDSGHFELHGVPGGHVELHFSGRSTDARLSFDNVAEHETIEIVVMVNGTTVEIEDNHRQQPDNRMEIEGIVSAVNATARTLRVRDTDVTVPAGTTIRHGSTAMTLADILVGDRVHVKGTKTGTTVMATEIEVQNDHPGPNPGPNTGPNPPPAAGHDDNDDNDDDNGRVELNGTVSGKAGTCPALTFSVGTASVATSTSTEFKDVSCTALKNGDRVEVKGSRLTTGGVVNATRVEKK